ncbi:MULTISPECIES: cupredoxin domain-containing protein [Lactobacillales]|jgi:Cu+-exporting ATPase|uniref:EfeO-type cupredoxin-like domain-containing protein n=2 Tax=Streptococcaceae TaxID=1300 RepID=A0A7X1ZCD9_9LACT|nr:MULTISPECIES: cupredoxin domain-containing protein [Lactobacillales]MDN5992537.1 cupredoxin domain-containing protein [Lactiplantibacillus plantarum]MDN6059330.1 cupredoxin domain-containing protein [Lacticaseibacillus paracasei]MDU1636776.1 cupredoxin domain-containing protein [Bacteroides ovatus]MBW9299159.1 hypothetical protein [Lactococcus raffinolactis]MBW9331713.1 hypothetical protein [Lactococcus raffinolactis]
MSLFGNSNEVVINVDGGYAPSSFKLKAGKPAKVTFKRTSDKGCTQQVIFNGETRDLPLNTPVSFDFVPEAGEHQFTCGMQMVKGSYTVK